MTMSCTRNRIAAGLALAGMALNAFWPLIVNARPNDVDIFAEICSTGSHKRHAGVPVKAPEKTAHASHCTLCAFSPERTAAVPIAGRAPLALPALAGARIEFRDARPVQAAFDPTAPPRAPPLFS
jgi:hypothetical protein